MPHVKLAGGNDEVRQSRLHRRQGLAHLPRHDDLRQSRVASLGARRRGEPAAGAACDRVGHQLFRYRRHVFRRCERGAHRRLPARVRPARRSDRGHQGFLSGRHRVQGRPGPRGFPAQQSQRGRPFAQADLERDRCLARAARHGLRGPLSDSSLGSGHADRRNDGSAARCGEGRQGALHRGELDVGLAVRQGAASGERARLDPLREHAEPLQPGLPRGGAGNDSALPRPGRGAHSLEPLRARVSRRQPQARRQ